MHTTTTATDSQQDARALLATVSHLMTGREIDICDSIVEQPGWDFMDELLTDSGISAFSRDQSVFASLCIQFYAQITNWKNTGVTA